MFIKFKPTFHFIGKRKCSKSMCGEMHGYSMQAVLDFFKHVLKLAKILNYIAIKGGGRPTRLLPHVKMLLIPIKFFLNITYSCICLMEGKF